MEVYCGIIIGFGAQLSLMGSKLTQANIKLTYNYISQIRQQVYTVLTLTTTFVTLFSSKRIYPSFDIVKFKLSFIIVKFVE